MSHDNLSVTLVDFMKPYLLMVDADPVVRAIYRIYFEQCGYEVTAVGSSLECLNMLDESTPDLLVLDSNLPGTGAQAVLATVRDEPVTVPVILTGSRAQEFKHQVGHLVFCLGKPFAMTQLHMYVREAMDKEAVVGERLEALTA